MFMWERVILVIMVFIAVFASDHGSWQKVLNSIVLET